MVLHTSIFFNIINLDQSYIIFDGTREVTYQYRISAWLNTLDRLGLARYKCIYTSSQLQGRPFQGRSGLTADCRTLCIFMTATWVAG